jgi:hypothetical protein
MAFPRDHPVVALAVKAASGAVSLAVLRFFRAPFISAAPLLSAGLRGFGFSGCIFLLGACATPTMRSGDPAEPLAALQRVLTFGSREATLADRIQTKTIDGFTLSACLLPDGEAQARYGVNLAAKGLQAVWLRAINNTPQELWLLRAQMDPDYYTADEAAFLFRHSWGGLGHAARQQRFRDLGIRARLEAGKTYEGHVLIPRTEGGRFVQVTINGHGRERRFGFPLRTPDGHFEFERLDPAVIYAGQPQTNLSRAQFRTRLEQLPPTVTNAKGTASGDPLNFVLVGDSPLMMAALSECGWSFTHRIDWTTIRRELGAALRGRPYLTAPVSPLYVFGRPQDLSFQRSRNHISQRNHLRVWLAPFTVEGQAVWIGQVSRDIGIKLTTKSSTLTTHVIDPMVDEARQFVLESLLARLRIRQFGFVRAAPAAPRDAPRTNLTGDPYITDGLRLVVFLASRPVRTEDVSNLGWEKTDRGPIEFGQSGESPLQRR